GGARKGKPGIVMGWLGETTGSLVPAKALCRKGPTVVPPCPGRIRSAPAGSGFPGTELGLLRQDAHGVPTSGTGPGRNPVPTVVQRQGSRRLEPRNPHLPQPGQRGNDRR